MEVGTPHVCRVSREIVRVARVARETGTERGRTSVDSPAKLVWWRQRRQAARGGRGDG